MQPDRVVRTLLFPLQCLPLCHSNLETLLQDQNQSEPKPCDMREESLNWQVLLPVLPGSREALHPWNLVLAFGMGLGCLISPAPLGKAGPDFTSTCFTFHGTLWPQEVWVPALAHRWAQRPFPVLAPSCREEAWAQLKTFPWLVCLRVITKSPLWLPGGSCRTCPRACSLTSS